MRGEIRRVCKEFSLTTVYVTHDQKEALSISDRMAILDSGRIRQVGAPGDVYRRPVCRLVANFIGETDFIAGRIVGAAGGRAAVETAVGRFEGVLGDPSLTPTVGANVTVSVRPECWKLGAVRGAQNSVEGRIGEAVYLGETAQYDFIAGGQTLKILELNPRVLAGADRGVLYASADPADVVVLAE
jgi:iron(III) transport system ATP-binding protein